MFIGSKIDLPGEVETPEYTYGLKLVIFAALVAA